MEQRLREVLEGREENCILPFFWQHGEGEELLREGMQRIRQSGIRAVCIESRPHPDYVGEGWWRDMDVILEEAGNLDMRVWVLDDAHFPSGYANGQVGKDSPYGKRLLDYYHVDVCGPMKHAGIILDLDEGEHLAAVTAGRRVDGQEERLCRVWDLGGSVKDGILYWDVPEGDWVVTVLKVTTKAARMRPGYINTLDREAVRFFLDTVYEPHFAHYGKLFGGLFAGFFSDEPEIGNAVAHYRVGHSQEPLPWCGQLEGLLQEKWGEGYGVCLTALFCDLEGISPRSRVEYMDLVTRLYGENFCGQIGDWCRGHGVEYIGHVIEDNGCHAMLGLGTGHYFRALAGQDMAGIDVVLQQIRPGFDDRKFHAIGGKGTYDGRFFHYGLAAMGVSLAYLDPGKKGRTMCEIFGAYGWAEGLKLMKWLADHMLVRGVNCFVPHAFTMHDFPDPDCPPHFYARGINPQYPYFGRLMDYMNRVSHLIQGGSPAWEVGIFYNACGEWAGDWEPFEETGRLLAQAQIPYAVLPEDALRGSCRGGRLTAGQVSCRVLILPYCAYLPEAVLDWCSAAAAAGMQILFLDQWPMVLETGERYRGEGLLLQKAELVSYLHGLGIEGAGCVPAAPGLRFFPYRQQEGNFYLFFNESVTEETDVRVSLPGAGKGLWRYDAFDNRLFPVREPGAGEQDGRVRLYLGPGEACIFYAGQAGEGDRPGSGESLGEGGTMQEGDALQEEDVLQEECVLVPRQGWKVRLDDCRREVYHDIQEWEMLEDVTAPGRFPSFSGVMEYEAVFDCPVAEAGDRVEIDCGEVYETLELWLNGRPLGVRIAPPYRLELPDDLVLEKEGNLLQAKVTNTLVHWQRDGFSRSMPMEPSGLLGPVKLTISRKKRR